MLMLVLILVKRDTGRCSIIVHIPILVYYRLDGGRVDGLMDLMHVK